MDDIIRGIMLVWAAAFVLIRMDNLVFIYMKRGQVRVLPAVILALAAPVLGLVSVALCTSEEFRRSWKGSTAYMVLVYCAILILSQAAAGFLAVQAFIFMGTGVPSGRAIGPASEPLGFSSVMLMVILGLAFLILLCMLLLFDPDTDEMFLGKGALKYSLLGAAVLVPVSVLSGVLLGGSSGGPVSTLMGSREEVLALFFAVSVLAPLSEEMFFRGYLFGSLDKKLGGGPAVLITSALFSLAHFDLVLLVPIFLMGLILGWIRSRSGSIVPSLIVHSMNNTLAVVWVVFWA